MPTARDISVVVWLALLLRRPRVDLTRWLRGESARTPSLAVPLAPMGGRGGGEKIKKEKVDSIKMSTLLKFGGRV